MNKIIDITETYILTNNGDEILATIKGDNSYNDIKHIIKKKGQYYDVDIVLFKPIDIKDFNILVNIRSENGLFVANYFLLNLPK